MYDLLQPFCLAQHFGNIKAANMSMCCLCRTADVGSGSHDSVGQHDELARQHSLSGICCKLCILFHAAQRYKVCMMSLSCDC